jgi:glycosyltransferase involved in cell wall biosynthesis
MRRAIKFVVSILACHAAGFVGSIFTRLAIPAWYVTLNKPSFTPPNWLFFPVWTTLYTLMGISAFLIWRKGLRENMSTTARNIARAAAEPTLRGPTSFRLGSISVVVPVRDDGTRLCRLLGSIAGTLRRSELLREVIVVDDGSNPPVNVSTASVQKSIAVNIIRESGRGPATARNAGAAIASGEWVLFLDSDCMTTETTIVGFERALDGSVAYAGNVRALGTDLLSRYYDTQQILIPPRDSRLRPRYLVTANALVWLRAFREVGGFDERFPCAGGEDIDLAYRLAQVGTLSFARESTVLHDFGGGLVGFWRRFIRYGRGNRLLAQHYRVNMRPRPFPPASDTPFNRLAATAQYWAMLWGYGLCEVGRITASSGARSASADA